MNKFYRSENYWEVVREEAIRVLSMNSEDVKILARNTYDRIMDAASHVCDRFNLEALLSFPLTTRFAQVYLDLMNGSQPRPKEVDDVLFRFDNNRFLIVADRVAHRLFQGSPSFSIS